jgi:hypothetical protein
MDNPVPHVDPCSIDSVPLELQSEYWWYLEECPNSEKTLTGPQWMQWRKLGVGKDEDFLQHTQLDKGT